MKKVFDRIEVLKEEMRTLLDTAEAEKRGLTDDEKVKFNAAKNEKDVLAMKIERRNLEASQPAFSQPTDMRATFAQVVDAVVNRRSLETFGDTVSENGIKIVERAATVTDATTVANMVPVSIGEVIEPLEKGLIIDKLGIKMQSGLIGELTFPTLQAIEASIANENAGIGDTNLVIGKITSTPKRVSISVPVSRRAISQTNYSLQGIVLKQISLGVARLLNKWMFSPTKLAGASDGPFAKVADFEYVVSPSFADAVRLETTVLDAGVNVTDGTAAYVCSPKVYGAMKSTPIENGSPKMLCENDTVNGYPVLVTNYAEADTLNFGVFSYAAIGQFGDMDMVIDPYTGAKSNTVNFVLNSDYDIVVARKEAFAVSKKKAGA